MLTWPRPLLDPQEERPQIVGASRTGGGSIAGPTQTVVTSGGGYWAFEFQVSLGTRDKILAWRAMEALLDGGATKFILPMCAAKFSAFTNTDTPHSDLTLFSDGAGYAMASTIVPASPAALRATVIYLGTAVAGLRAGQDFSIEHPTKSHRLYRIGSVSDDGLTLTIRPPLREAITTTTPLEFANPKCVMKLTNPDGFAASIRMSKVGQGTASFAEAPV